MCLMIGAVEAEPKVEVREFSTFTADIEAMKAWLVQAGCPHVVGEYGFVLETCIQRSGGQPGSMSHLHAGCRVARSRGIVLLLAQ